MATSDVHGHRVPTGSDFAARKSLTDLSLSIMGGPKSVGSLAAATLYVADVTAALSAAGLPPISADNGLYVWRSDTQALMRHDGAAWEWVTPRDTGWVDVPCVASNSTVQVRRVGDRVSLRGDLYNSGSAPIGGNSITGVLGTLPDLFRAPKTQWTLCNSWVAGLPTTSPAYGRPMGLVVYESGGLLLQNPQSQAITCAELWGVNLWTN